MFKVVDKGFLVVADDAFAQARTFRSENLLFFDRHIAIVAREVTGLARVDESWPKDAQQ